MALLQPWIGIAANYLITILDPQAIWWWQFSGLRPLFFVIIFSGIGLLVAMLRGKLRLNFIKSKINFWLFVLWICFITSYLFGPYVDKAYEYGPFHPDWVMSLINKIMFIYFVGCVCINTEKKLDILGLIMIASVIYLIYWMNDQYLFQGKFGRIHGPMSPDGVGTYSDQNAFAMFFATGIPFLYFMGMRASKKIVRYGLWLIVPFGWHAIFLTGSRGGLLGAGATILVASLRSTKKIVGLLFILLFMLAYVWQAGNLMKNRASTIQNYQEDDSAESRIEAWKAAIEIVKSHPLTGAGLTSFVAAFRDYSPYQPRQAHNTFFQIAGESGIIAAIAYLFICVIAIKNLFQNSRFLRARQNDASNLFYLNEAVLHAFIGCFVCSLFLSLQEFEIFYFLCLLTHVTTKLSLLRAQETDLHSYKIHHDIQSFQVGIK